MGDIFDAFSEDTDKAQESSKAQPKRRKKGGRAAAVIVLVLAVLAGITYTVLPSVWDRISNNPISEVLGDEAEDYEEGEEGEPARVTIPVGSTGSDMATVMYDNDVVKSTEAFIEAFNADTGAGSIRPGTYELPTKIPGQRAVELLQDYENHRVDVTITIPEGFTAQQVHERIANLMDVPLDDVLAAADDSEAIGLPEEAEGNPEGWYKPGQYLVSPDAEVESVLSEMISARVSQLNSLDIADEDRQELLIKASILEREVNTEQYYSQVARVIENRLVDTASVNGRLQMDSTVLYGVGKSGGIPTGEDLANDNPYNSYMYAGLPPTPIGNPGISAIEGVLNPADGDWLYFVTVDLHTGETLFAGTLEEHNANKAQLDAWLEENPNYGREDVSEVGGETDGAEETEGTEGEE